MFNEKIELTKFTTLLDNELEYLISLSFSNNSKYIGFSFNNDIFKVYDLIEKKYIINLDSNIEIEPFSFENIFFTKDLNKIIFSAKKIILFDINTKDIISIPYSEYSINFAYNNECNFLYYPNNSESNNSFINIFDIENWNLIKNIPLESKIFRDGNFYSEKDSAYLWVEVMAISEDNNLLAVACSDLIIRIIDLETLEILKYLQGHKNDIKSMIFTHNGNYLISGADKEELAFFWNTKTWELEKIFGNYDETYDGISCDYNEMNFKGLSITSNDKYLIISTRDKFKITFLDTEEMKIVKEIKGLKYVKDVAISNDDKYIAYSDDYEGTVKIFELKINEN